MLRLDNAFPQDDNNRAAYAASLLWAQQLPISGTSANMRLPVDARRLEILASVGGNFVIGEGATLNAVAADVSAGVNGEWTAGSAVLTAAAENFAGDGVAEGDVLVFQVLDPNPQKASEYRTYFSRATATIGSTTLTMSDVALITATSIIYRAGARGVPFLANGLVVIDILLSTMFTDPHIAAIGDSAGTLDVVAY